MVLTRVFDPGEFLQNPIHLAGTLELVNRLLSQIVQVPFKQLFNLCAQEKISLYVSLSVTSFFTTGFPNGRRFLWLLYLLLSYPSLCGLSVVCCAEAVQSNLSCSSRGIAIYVGVYSVCLWEEVSLGSCYANILDLPLCHQYFNFYCSILFQNQYYFSFNLPFSLILRLLLLHLFFVFGLSYKSILPFLGAVNSCLIENKKFFFEMFLCFLSKIIFSGELCFQNFQIILSFLVVPYVISPCHVLIWLFFL